MKWTPEHIATLTELYPKRTAKEIAAEIGCTTGAVRMKAYELCLPKKSVTITVEQFAEAAKRGETSNEFCRRTGCSHSGLLLAEKRYGIKLRRAREQAA